MDGTNDTEQKRSINTLYLGRVENGSSHIIFKLDTKAAVLVNRVVIIPTSKTVINCINKMRISVTQPKSVHFTDRDGRVSSSNLDLNLDDNNDKNSNASDKSFDCNKEYQIKSEIECKDEALSTNEVQDDHFQLLFQQHHALITDKPSKMRSVGKSKMKRTKKHKLRRFSDTITLEMKMIAMTMMTTMIATVALGVGTC